MKSFKSHFLVGIVATLIGAGLILASVLFPAPAKSALTPLAGTVIASTHVQTTRDNGYARVVLDTLPPGNFLSIPYTLPFNRACARVALDARVSALALRAAFDDESWLVLALDVNGAPCVPYEDFALEAKTQAEVAVWLGALLLVSGLAFLARGIFLRRQRA
jgi:hypothetical protein